METFLYESRNRYTKPAMLHACLKIVYSTARKVWNGIKHPLAQTNNNRHSDHPAVHYNLRIKSTWRSADVTFFSSSLWLNKHCFSCYQVLTYCSRRQFSLKGGGRLEGGVPGQTLCQAWEYENGGDRMLMRRPEALPPTAVPWSALLCQPVMNLWGCAPLTCHPVTQSFSTNRREKQKHSVRYSVLSNRCVACLQTNNNTFRMLPESA